MTTRTTGACLFILLAVLLAWFRPAAAGGGQPAPEPDRWGERRVALVIGNGDYRYAVRLANPRNDALALAAALRRLGFEVVEAIDADRVAMIEYLRRFGGMAATADAAVVFYAGHGLQIEGANYLAPVDLRPGRLHALSHQLVALDLVLTEAARARRIGVVILDACRDSPVTRRIAEPASPDAASSPPLSAFAIRK